jgi:hypothetical protein
MGVVALVARAELRKRWKILVLLGLLAGLAGGVAIGALAGARRTATAFDRSLEATNPGDVIVRGFAPGAITSVPSMPQVEASWSGLLTIGKDLEASTVSYFSIVSGPPPPAGLFTPQVVSGRLPDPADLEEAAISEGFGQAMGLHNGDTIDLKLLTADDIANFGIFDEPGGPTVHFRIVGVVRVTGTSSNQFLPILATPAYYEAHRNDAGADFVVASLHGRAADVAAVRHQLEAAISGPAAPKTGSLPPFDLITPRDEAAAAARASHVVVTGLLLLAAIAAAAGIVAVIQAAGLFAARRRSDQETMSSLGLTRGQRFAAAAVPVAFVGAPVAAIVSIAVAVAGSSFTPVGSASNYEPRPGLELNLLITAAGAIVVALSLVLGAAWIATRRAARAVAASARPSAAERLGRAGVQPPEAVGARFALERGSGRTAVPVRSTMLAAVIGVAGIVAAAAYGGSFHRVVQDPQSYGYPADIEVVDVQDSQAAMLADRPDVKAVAIGNAFAVRVGNSDAVAVALDPRKGTIEPTMLDGRQPGTKDEVALGPAIASAAHVGVGDDVTIRDPGGVERIVRVVGTQLMDGNAADDYDRTALFTVDGLRAFGDEPSRTAYVRFNPDIDVAAARASLASALEVEGPTAPTSIRNLEQLDRLPIILASFFAFIALIALANAGATAVVRRRRDIAVLRAVGFTPRQSGRVLFGMMTTIAVVGIAIGVPLGLLIGRLLWRTVADSIHVTSSGVAPLAAIAIASLATLALANAIGIVPAALAARRTPATDLRAE